MTLYRIGNPQTVAGFWSPDPDYVRSIHGADKPVITAELSPAAVVKRLSGNANQATIEVERLAEVADVLIFQAWDWDADEYVVLNPEVLILKNQTAT